MLVGAHVSPAGGLVKALERGEARNCRAIQIFNQNPRAWAPRVYADDEIAAWHERVADSPIDALLIHAVYLLNCASENPDFRAKSVLSLSTSLRMGAALGARAVVLHPGSALVGGDAEAAIPRASEAIAAALAESDTCPLHLENTAGAGGTLGRSFEELARLIDLAGSGERLGVCLDSCHLYASGYDVSTEEGLGAVLDAFDSEVGLGRLGSLHFNDSQTPLGSNRDRHANTGEGELGETGARAWFTEPRFQDLPCVLETPGRNRSGPTAEEIARVQAWNEAGR